MAGLARFKIGLSSPIVPLILVSDFRSYLGQGFADFSACAMQTELNKIATHVTRTNTTIGFGPQELNIIPPRSNREPACAQTSVEPARRRIGPSLSSFRLALADCARTISRKEPESW